MVRLCSALCVFAVSGCGLILDFDPPDPIPGSSDGSVDTFDASYTDAQIDGDGGLPADAAFADADTSDASLDGGVDASFDAGMRRCEDSTSGVCIRFTNAEASPPVIGWVANFYFTVPSGALYEIPWAASCDLGFRTIDARTTECELEIPDPGMPTRAGSGVTIYAYPIYAVGPACDTTRCPEFYMGYEMWRSGVPFSTVPSDGIVSLVSRPIFSGSMLMVLRIDTTL